MQLNELHAFCIYEVLVSYAFVMRLFIAYLQHICNTTKKYIAWDLFLPIHTNAYLKVENMPAIGFEIKRKCKVCGEVFLAKTLDSQYCSPKCSKVAWKRKYCCPLNLFFEHKKIRARFLAWNSALLVTFVSCCKFQFK